jgi:predicted nucleotide-binding protein (sugar kinase/HSP70/actin superfamily)
MLESHTHKKPSGQDLPVHSEADNTFDLAEELSGVEVDIQAFEREERKRLGLPSQDRHWRDAMIDPQFKKSERAKTTLLVSGLTAAHDYLVKAALRGLGYNVEVIDVPDNEALRYGKEFGNRGQCNPTYFTVGNLVKYLTERCRDEGIAPKEAVDRYIFLTAGACGPCRFGMYATEYRKALRDAGFDGFRVMLFQQTGGLAQANGEEAGIDFNPKFFLGILKALLAGDVLNGLGYRLRPFEIEPGSTDRALAAARTHLEEALSKRTSILLSLVRAKKEFAKVKCDFTRPAPRVSIIGEFWAMTTEGEGNYQLQRFLESEGAECDVQLVTNWLLYMLWESRHDVRNRMHLRGQDQAYSSLKGPGADVHVHRLKLFFADWAVRTTFQLFANLAGFRGYVLPDMVAIWQAARDHYNTQVRGGEGHMEVGKYILNVLHNKSHMTLSVKPFGCMPSSGVSDGVQSLITAKFPQSLFCSIETSGDGKVNVHSRVQMTVFKARQAAQQEYQQTLERLGITSEAVQALLTRHPRLASPLRRSPHGGAGTALDRLVEVAPLVGQSPTMVYLLDTRNQVKHAMHTAERVLRNIRRDLREIVEDTISGPVANWRATWKRVSKAVKSPEATAAAPKPTEPLAATPIRSAKLSIVTPANDQPLSSIPTKVRSTETVACA